jgi:glycosyltransferase involved in cell wall biosynthesis
MKIFIPKIREAWVVDRFRKEWINFNPKLNTHFIRKADIVWILAPWLWDKLSEKHLISKKVACTIHHIENDKFFQEVKRFDKLNTYVDVYHVISNKTYTQLCDLTDKRIVKIPFWVNQQIWKPLNNKSEIRKKFGFGEVDFLVGSFQRDTEGSDLISPKLIKGPDILVKLLKSIFVNNKNLKVVLTGKRRQYLINNLENLKIPYFYFEDIDEYQVNELYNILNLYLVTSRLEGGPQAIVECANIGTPILSTDVGIASEILHSKAIYNLENFQYSQTDEEFAHKNVVDLTLPNGMKKYRELFFDLNEN